MASRVETLGLLAEETEVISTEDALLFDGDRLEGVSADAEICCDKGRRGRIGLI